MAVTTDLFDLVNFVKLKPLYTTFNKIAYCLSTTLLSSQTSR